MAGKIKNVIDAIIQERAKGDTTIENITAAKLALKGIFRDRFTDDSDDDPGTLSKLRDIIHELDLNIPID